MKYLLSNLIDDLTNWVAEKKIKELECLQLELIKKWKELMANKKKKIWVILITR